MRNLQKIVGKSER